MLFDIMYINKHDELRFIRNAICCWQMHPLSFVLDNHGECMRACANISSQCKHVAIIAALVRFALES